MTYIVQKLYSLSGCMSCRSSARWKNKLLGQRWRARFCDSTEVWTTAKTRRFKDSTNGTGRKADPSPYARSLAKQRLQRLPRHTTAEAERSRRATVQGRSRLVVLTTRSLSTSYARDHAGPLTCSGKVQGTRLL